MNIKRLRFIQDEIMRAIVQSESLELPEWRFDGKAITRPEEVAAYCGISVAEAKMRMEFKDVYAASGAGAITRGVGARTVRQAIEQRANALAYAKRRRRRNRRRTQA